MAKDFVTLLTPKLLTANQIIYLVNMVLLPRLEYRSMVTPLSDTDINAITRSYRTLLKRKSKLVASAPNAFLHDPRGPYGLIDLKTRLAQSHISHLHQLLNTRTPTFDALQIRLNNLQFHLWLPFSPLYLTSFSPWSKLNYVKNSWLAATVASAAALDIRFVQP